MNIERKNQELWMQGLYIYNAFGSVLANVFSKNGSKKQSYMEEPIRLFPMTEEEQKEKEKKELEKINRELKRLMDRQKNKKEKG